jgi:hypothetical protein
LPLKEDGLEPKNLTMISPSLPKILPPATRPVPDAPPMLPSGATHDDIALLLKEELGIMAQILEDGRAFW